MLGLLEHQLGRNGSALELLERSLLLEPANPRAHNNLGNVLYSLGRGEESVQHYRRTLELMPDAAGTHNNLGKVLTDLGRFDEAEGCFLRALALSPNSPAINNDLGTLHHRQGRHAEAIQCFRRALELDPRYGDAHSNLANALKGLGRGEESEKHYRLALEMAPASPRAHVNLGTSLHERGASEEARQHFRRALELNPDDAVARWALAMAQLPAIPESKADADRSRAAFATELAGLADWLGSRSGDDGWLGVGNHRPFFLAYQEADNRALLSQYGQLCAREMGRWQSAHGLSLQQAAAGDVLRIGIVSAHVFEHSVWRAIVKGWLKHLDRAKFSLHLFAIDAKHDRETAIARSLSASFETGNRSLKRWAAAILASRLDALVYPEIGMDPITIQLASMRLAPLQMACWGHPETTGLPTIDCYLSAAGMEPASGQDAYTEQLIRLPGLGCCYERLPVEDVVLDLAAMGIDGNAPLLVCPGTPWKYAPERDRVLVDIARALGRCRFVFFRDASDGLWRMLQARLEGVFAQENLKFADFGTFVPWQPRPRFHALLKRAEVCLDSIGFSGFNTAMQAVECGVPMVAWDGRFLRGRLASGVLKALGLGELVATNEQEYIALAVRLATDSDYRHQVREHLAARADRLLDDVAPIRGLEEFLTGAARPRSI